MRKLVAALGVACLAGTASAQVAGGPVPLSLDCKIFDDGSGSDSWWKLNNPAGSSDWFNVDFDADCQSTSVLGICTDVWNTLGANETMTIGVYPESGAFPNTPDIANPIQEVNALVSATDGFADLVSYALPCFHLGSTDIHVAMQQRSGDSATWLGADTFSPAFNRSFVSTTAYNTGALIGGLNWQLGLTIRPANASKNSFLVNGSPSVTLNVGGTWCMVFWGTQVSQRSLLFFCIGGAPLVNLGIPIPFTTTGNAFFPGPKAETFEICSNTGCGFLVGPVTLCLIYQDFCDLKPNNKPKLKVSSTITVNTVDPQNACIGCYGTKDDGDHDGFVWKVTNPSGPSDWFVVNLGTAQTNTGAGAGNVCVTSVEVSLTEICAVDGQLAHVGHHPLASGVDPNVTVTPNLAAGDSLQNILVPANVTSDSCYPGQVYTLPTGVPVSPGGTPYIAAVGWVSGDTCIWIASDTDGTDVKSGCGTILPNNCSATSADDFATNAAPSTTVNWAIKVNWVEK